jgi:hypothetical protein
MIAKFYVYQYLRKDLTPYYIGKGTGYRMNSNNRVIMKPKNKELIQVVAHKMYEHEAFLLERKLIKLYGRKDNGTGILRNLTDGGEGASGSINSYETRLRKQGRIPWNKGLIVGPETLETRTRKSIAKIGKTRSVESCAKQSIRNRGNTYTKGKTWKVQDVTCPYCLLIGGSNNMKRWHFNNCKHK